MAQTHKKGSPTAFRKPKNTRSTLGRLIGYLGAYRLLLPLVFLMMIGASVLSLACSYLLKPLIDDCILPNVGAEFPNWAPLSQTLLTLGFLYLFALVTTYGQSALMMVISHRSVHHIRKDLFNQLQDTSLQYFDTHTHGELMSRFTNDADNVEMAIEQSFTSFLSSIITLTGTVILMILLNWQLFCITAVFLVIAITTSQFISIKSRILFRTQQKNLGVLNSYIEEIITGSKTVKSFCYEKQSQNEFAKRNNDFRIAATKANFLGMSMMPTINQILGICYALTTIAGAYFVVQQTSFGGIFTVGSLGVFLTYTKQVRMPINQITNQFVTLMSALAGAERIFEAMDQPPETNDGNICLANKENNYYWVENNNKHTTLQGHIQFQNVQFSYTEHTQDPVIRNLTLDALPGQKIALVGSTGAGKTTITNLLNRFYEIQDGQILYDGFNICDIQKDSLRNSMGVVLQDTHLFTGTILENIRYGNLLASDEECIEAAKTANADTFIEALPKGYLTNITADGNALSQGQRQLLNIARAILAKRPVIILDEATSSVDTYTEHLIDIGLSRLMAGKTVFIIAHRLSTIRNADKIAVIEQGSIIEFGNHAQLLAQNGRYHQLYTGQHSL